MRGFGYTKKHTGKKHFEICLLGYAKKGLALRQTPLIVFVLFVFVKL